MADTDFWLEYDNCSTAAPPRAWTLPELKIPDLDEIVNKAVERMAADHGIKDLSAREKIQIKKYIRRKIQL